MSYDKVLEYMQCSAAALEAAKKERDKSASAKKEVEDLIPLAVDAMVANDRIDERMREKAAKLLQDPAQALKLLIKLADVRNTVRPPSLGKPEMAEKKASATGQTKKSYNDFKERLFSS
jgi:hypothetical protein